MKLLTLPLTVALLVFAVACSGDDDGPPTSATTTITDATATPVPDDAPGTPIADAGSTESVSFVASPAPVTDPALLIDVRVGAHPEDGGYDRIVFEFESQRPSGLVGYQDQIEQCGSGEPVDPAGNAMLKVHFDFSNAHNEAGEMTIASTTVSGPGNSILESIRSCDFEAEVEWAIGTAGKKPFTVTLLDGPPRVVIDVAH